MSYTIVDTRNLVTEQCCKCGVVFAFPEDMQRRALANRGPTGRQFYCPNGHGQHYTGKTEAQLERERADRLASQLASRSRLLASREEDLHVERLSHRATRGHLTRVKKRVGQGVCPCCKRSFKDLARHMSGQHPGYGGPA